MDHKVIAHIDLRQLTVNCKLITILAKASRHIIYMITWRIFLAKNRNMMVCTVDGRTHQVGRTCIHSDVLLVNMLLMDCLGNKTSIRSEHESSHLGVDCNIPHTCRNKNFIISFMNALTDHMDIVWLLVRCIRDSDTSGEVYKTDIASCLVT